jgi:hypothetical protein
MIRSERAKRQVAAEEPADIAQHDAIAWLVERDRGQVLILRRHPL